MKRSVLILLPLCLLAGCESPGNVFRKMFPPSPKKMVAMATNPDDADMRRQGLMMLSSQSYGTKDEFVEVYVDILLTDPEPTVRSAAARAIGKSGNGKYAGQLAQGLSDSDTQVRWDVAIALDNVVGDGAVDPLRNTVSQDESKDVRAAAAVAMRHYPRMPVILTLVDALDDEAFAVQFQARKALVDMTGYPFGYEPEDWAPVASGQLPMTAPRTERPWWDVLQVTDPKPAGQIQ
ncbi:MAG: HEAT repeat domain-containing protein [Phycisphaerae bacterium]